MNTTRRCVFAFFLLGVLYGCGGSSGTGSSTPTVNASSDDPNSELSTPDGESDSNEDQEEESNDPAQMPDSENPGDDTADQPNGESETETPTDGSETNESDSENQGDNEPSGGITLDDLDATSLVNATDVEAFAGEIAATKEPSGITEDNFRDGLAAVSRATSQTNFFNAIEYIELLIALVTQGEPTSVLASTSNSEYLVTYDCPAFGQLTISGVTNLANPASNGEISFADCSAKEATTSGTFRKKTVQVEIPASRTIEIYTDFRIRIPDTEVFIGISSIGMDPAVSQTVTANSVDGDDTSVTVSTTLHYSMGQSTPNSGIIADISLTALESTTTSANSPLSVADGTSDTQTMDFLVTLYSGDSGALRTLAGGSALSKDTDSDYFTSGSFEIGPGSGVPTARLLRSEFSNGNPDTFNVYIEPINPDFFMGTVSSYVIDWTDGNYSSLGQIGRLR